MVDAVALDSFVSPYAELIALESLYADEGMTLRKVTASTVRKNRLPSEALRDRDGMIPVAERTKTIEKLIDSKIGSFSVVVNNTPSWPEKLAASERPTPLLYYRGNIGIIETKGVSVVGARKASDQGLARASRFARELVNAGVTVVTGLAHGIDTAATMAALQSKGNVIGVIGTPIDEVYPKENKTLQETIARSQLLISQVPFYRYSTEPFNAHRTHFPERNELMAAISDATVIVEASDTSGTLSQARACLHQGRPLFIMRSLLENPEILWPQKFLDKEGVFVLENTQQVLDAIGSRDV